MKENNKIHEISQLIEEKTKSISELKKQRANTKEVAGMVTLDKQIKDAERDLNIYEQAKKAAAYIPPEPADRDLLLSGVNKYLEKKTATIKEIAEQIGKKEAELMQVSFNLQAAIENGDAESAVFYSAQKEELSKWLEYLEGIKSDTENIPVFPEGAIIGEWEKICENVKPDYRGLLTVIENFADGYRKACDRLLEMNSTLLSVRDELGRIAEADGSKVWFYPILTTGINIDSLKISKSDGLKPGFIINNFSGKALL